MKDINDITEQLKVSVILPNYNREETLGRAIDSVLQQTYNHIELIIVDDGSTDSSISIIKSYSDERVLLVCLNERSGACKARNVGVELATGSYIAFQDSDDEWNPDFIEHLLGTCMRQEVDIAFCRFRRHSIRRNEVKLLPDLTSKIIDYHDLIYGSVVSTQTMLGRASCFKDNPFDTNMPRLQDYELIIRLGQKFKVYHTKEVLVDIYVQNDSLSEDVRKLIPAVEHILTVHNKILSQYSDVKARLLDLLASTYLRVDQVDGNLYKEALLVKFSFRRLIKCIIFYYNPLNVKYIVSSIILKLTK